jgi:hypothetical protein
MAETPRFCRKKRRFHQPARRPVIANPQGEAIHTGTLDCFTLRVRNDVRDSLNCIRAGIYSTRPRKKITKKMRKNLCRMKKTRPSPSLEKVH